MKIEINIVASGKADKAIVLLKDVVNYIRSGQFQRELSGDDVKAKATVKVLEDEK